VLFNTLEKEDIDKIIDIELEKLLNRISELGYKLKLSKKARNFIAEKGFDKQYGARPLKRAIQKYVEDAIAEEIIKSNVQEGDSITMDIGKNDTELNVKITSPKKSEEQ
jgi:ATP-dependent Clp protease ATP-binding subunit ClpC